MIQKPLHKSKSKPTATLTVETAIKFLSDRGYCVEKVDNNIPILQAQIIKQFYSDLRNLLGDRRALILNVQDKEDIRAIDRYIKKASRFGISKVVALQHLKDALTLLFKEYNTLKLTQPPKSINFLLSSNGNWIIDKLMLELEKRVAEYEDSEEATRYKESLYETVDDTFLELQKQRHEKLLKE